ncbi:MAG: methyltransferase [Desulfurococcales archaeon]|nr:methyltransferase [Desulfurococcales archaeon]
MGCREATGDFLVRRVVHGRFQVNYAVHPCIYKPEEDTFLLADSLIKASHKGLKPRSIIELGVGSGYISSLVLSLWNPKLFVGTDINWLAVEGTRISLSMNEAAFSKASIALCDKDTCIREHIVFDLAVSNPPYLPVDDEFRDECDKLLNRSWSCEHHCLIEFCASLCRRGRVIFMVLSSLSPLDEVFKCMKQFNCQAKIVERRKFFFEEILVVMGEHVHDDTNSSRGNRR